MRVLVMGSGGLGGYFGGLLAQAGEDVGFVARGAHLDALKERGLKVQSVHGDFQLPVQAMENPAQFGVADLVLFAVKGYDSETAAKQLLPALGAETAVLSLQNGVNAVERLEPILGAGRVLPGAVYIIASIVEPGVIEQASAARRIVFGEPHGPRTPRVEHTADALRNAGAEVDVRDEVEVALWEKYVYICALSGLTGLTRCSIGPILACEETSRLYDDALREGYAVGRAAGVEIDEGIVERFVAIANHLPPESKSSLLYDLEHGKPLEIEILSGHLVRLAEQYDVDVPVQRVIAADLRLANSLVSTGPAGAGKR